MADRAELEIWKAKIQDYLDGNLTRTQALQFYLMARREPELKAELESYRMLLRSLEGSTRLEPSADFDARILASVPLERYRNAPPRSRVRRPVQETLLSRSRRPVGKGLLAVGAAYALFLGAGHSFLARWAGSAADALRGPIDSLAGQVDHVPVLSTVVRGLADAYDAALGGMASLSSVLGSAVVTVSVGLLAGWLALLMADGLRRQRARRANP